MNSKYTTILIIIILLVSATAGCTGKNEKNKLEKVGLLVPDTINDQVWGTNGYKGMLKIQSKYDVEVFHKEGINSQVLAERAIEEFSHKGVNLVFGHGNEYAEYFNKASAEYPNIHFISFNGNATGKNTTSLKFDSYAMGFFGGMTAAHFSKTGTIGIIPAYKWQPEVKGFVEGAKYERKDIRIVMDYVESWDDKDRAVEIIDNMLSQKIDVVYPAGDGYNVPVIEKLKANGVYAIGYVSDQSSHGEETVLTSTIQHVDKLYLLVADRFSEGDLQSGNLHFDFADDVISLAEFSPLVADEFVAKIDGYVKEYIQTGKLPGKEKGKNNE